MGEWALMKDCVMAFYTASTSVIDLTARSLEEEAKLRLVGKSKVVLQGKVGDMFVLPLGTRERKGQKTWAHTWRGSGDVLERGN